MMEIPLWLQFVLVIALVVVAAVYLRKAFGRGSACDCCSVRENCAARSRKRSRSRDVIKRTERSVDR